MVRKILAVVVGLAVAIITFVVVETLNHAIFPLQKSANGNTVLTIQFLLLVIVGWACGSFLAGLIIKIISQSDSYILPLIAGIILTLSGIANLFAMPHPVWFAIISVIIFIPMVFLGYKIYGNR